MEYTELTDEEMLQINRQRLRNVQLEHYQHEINREVAMTSTAMTDEQKSAAIRTAEEAMAILEEQAKAAKKEMKKVEAKKPPKA